MKKQKQEYEQESPEKIHTLKSAVALNYDGKKAPVLSAKGQHELAEEIIKIAKAHDILIHQDAQLTQLLATLELGEEIPEALYVTIAKVIAFAYMLNGKVPKAYKKSNLDDK